MGNVLKIGSEYRMVTDDNEAITVTELLNLMTINLGQDISEFRKGKKELSQQIAIETNAVTALSEAVRVLS